MDKENLLSKNRQLGIYRLLHIAFFTLTFLLLLLLLLFTLSPRIPKKIKKMSHFLWYSRSWGKRHFGAFKGRNGAKYMFPH